jgi:hypothetical protein
LITTLEKQPLGAWRAAIIFPATDYKVFRNSSNLVVHYNIMDFHKLPVILSFSLRQVLKIWLRICNLLCEIYVIIYRKSGVYWQKTWLSHWDLKTYLEIFIIRDEPRYKKNRTKMSGQNTNNYIINFKNIRLNYIIWLLLFICWCFHESTVVENSSRFNLISLQFFHHLYQGRILSLIIINTVNV